MQYLNRAIHEKGYQESSVDKSTTTQLRKSQQSSSSCDLRLRRLRRPSQGSVVFRHDDSAGHHIKNNVRPFRHDNSAGRSQRAKREFSFQRNQAQYVCVNAQQTYAHNHASSTSTNLTKQGAQQPAQVYCPSNFSTNSTEATTCSNPKLLKNIRTTGQQSQRHTNTATTSRSSIPETPVSKLVSIESPREDELSATNLAPNGGVKRRQSTEIGFE
ncbi:hypothetical protein F511_43314 [Dorcoceras hygrometricum]|uniref:Uncharacterized protein n=1 Tax=Dorcoceras hygrometricum TaxID=472368 RepID=A0A2Z7AD95_9LAMI|nr:hypothetical protein F511_43314 [Dorcoceras hygrometricum]